MTGVVDAAVLVVALVPLVPQNGIVGGVEVLRLFLQAARTQTVGHRLSIPVKEGCNFCWKVEQVFGNSPGLGIVGDESHGRIGGEVHTRGAL